MTFLKVLGRAIAAGLLIWPLLSHALQVVDASDGKTRQLNVSTTEMTRIAFEGGRIRSVKYDPAELEVNEDNGVGQIFIKPLVRTKPISIFVITSTDTTHALTLQPIEMGLGSIVIQEPKKERPDRPAASRSTRDRATAFDSEIRRLVTTMARDERPQDYEKKVENKEYPLWQGTRFILLSTWKGRGLRGEWYRLLNDSRQAIRVIEQEFFQEDVAAVSVELHELLPSSHTNVFIVRRDGKQ